MASERTGVERHALTSPSKHAATAGPGLRLAPVLVLQRLAGNTAVANLLRTGVAIRRSSLIQRVQWTTANTATRGGLSAELRRGLELAVTSPTAKPNPMPAWITARAKASIDYDTAEKAIPNDVKTTVDDAWNGLPAVAKGKNDETTWKQKRTATETKKAELALASKLKDTIKNRWDGEFKWNVAFDNTDGDLPGLAGAGGYAEYYCEPAAGSDLSDGFWGKNRALRATAAGPNQGKWWVTADHYVHYVQVTDA